MSGGEAEIYRKTRRLRIAVVSPRKRHCQHAMVTQRSTSKAMALGPQHFQLVTDDRQRLTRQTDCILRSGVLVGYSALTTQRNPTLCRL